jgi:hypothetical protein
METNQMSKQSTVEADVPIPTLVVYGLDEANKPHAACFNASQSELALKAAGLMGMQVITAWPSDRTSLVQALPAGRIFANGRGFVPNVRRDVYEQIVALATAQTHTAAETPQSTQPENATPNSTESPAPIAQPSKPSPRPGSALPRHWHEIQVGQLVIAPDEDARQNGWLLANVVSQDRELCTLRWQAYPRQKMVRRHRFNLGLIYPGPCFAGTQEQPPQLEPTGANPYPRHWDHITPGCLVLARDEAPEGAWWESIVVEANGETITLRWRDYPQLPNVVRYRLNLGLLYSNPR